MAEHVEKLATFPRRLSFDRATLLGLVGGLVLIVAAIGLGGSAAAFLNVPGLLIVVGGTLAVTTVCFTLRDVTRTIGILSTTFLNRTRDPEEAAHTMLDLADYVRKHGVLRLQGAPLQRFSKDPVLFRAISMLVEGLPEKDISDILSEEMAATTARVQRSANVLRKAAEISPAMGLIGTLIGLVQMLGNLQDPSVIGPAMAVALLTTFYGVVLANMVFNPLAAKLERNAAEEHLIGYLYSVGTISIIRKDPLRRLEMLLNSALPPESKVRFGE